MAAMSAIRAVHCLFSRHERRYCIFSVSGRNEDFLYYSHTSNPLRALMFGVDFTGKLPGLLNNEDLCIECGLGLSVKGGVALDKGDCIAWYCTVEEANAVLASLKEHLGNDRGWIELF
jgi:hypothetical protein